MAGDYRLGYRPALNGLRGAAVFLVIADHTFAEPEGSPGVAGVTLFFVLSGFLITRLLLEKMDETGRMNLAAFWARRAARLFPALLLFLAAMAATGTNLAQIIAAGLYLSNLVIASAHDMGGLGHTWSLALEEQFYLLWPILLFCLIRQRRVAIVVLITGVLAVSAWREWLVVGGAGKLRLFGPDVRVDALLLGCLLALAAPWVASHVKPWTAYVGATVIAISCCMPQVATAPLGLTAVTIASAAVVAWAATQPARVLVVAVPLRWLGTISYGVYLWHYQFAALLEPLPEWARFAGTFAGSVAVATASWWCVERPVMAWARRRNRASAIPSVDGRPVGGATATPESAAAV